MSFRSVRATERNHVLSKHKINKYDKIIKFVGEWEELEKKIIPSNITQIQKAKYGIHHYMWILTVKLWANEQLVYLLRLGIEKEVGERDGFPMELELD